MISPRTNKQESESVKAHRQYSDQFKGDAVALVERPESNIRKVAEGLGISQVTLRNWQRQIRERTAVPAVQSAEQLAAENRRLRAELEHITMQRDILKKACGILSVPVKGMPQ